MAGTNFGKLAHKIRGGESATVQEASKSPAEIVVTRRPNRHGLIGSQKIVRIFVSNMNARPIIVTLNDPNRISIFRFICCDWVIAVVICSHHTNG